MENRARKVKKIVIKNLPKKLHKKSLKRRFFGSIFMLIFCYIILRTIGYSIVYFEGKAHEAYVVLYKDTVSRLAHEEGFVAYVPPPKSFTIKNKLIQEMKVNSLSPGLYPILRGLIKRESNDNIYAESGSGAKGLMQLMPETTRKCGFTDPKEAFDPIRNIECGVWWYKKMLESQGGRVALSLQEYNGGINRIGKTTENINYPDDVLGAMLSLPPSELIYEEN